MNKGKVGKTDVFTKRMNAVRPQDGGASSDVPGEETSFSADTWWKRFQARYGTKSAKEIIKMRNETLKYVGPPVGSPPRGWLNRPYQRHTVPGLPSGDGTNFFADAIYARDRAS